MGIIFKFIFKNMREKKFRTFLIVFSIMLSSALFFASNGLSGTISNMFVGEMKKYFGSADIIIHANERSPTKFVAPAPAQGLGDRVDYIIGSVEGQGYYKPSKDEMITIELKGFEWKDLEVMNPMTLNKSKNMEPFAGRSIIINQVFADQHQLDIGQTIDIELNAVKQRFRIVGIAIPSGPLKEDGRSITAVVPRETLASLYNTRGKSYSLYIKAGQGEDKLKLIEELSALYPRYTVRETLSKAEINQQISMITTPYMMMTLLVLFMSVFIIYTSFKVISMERLPVIGTFRSIGATRKMTDFVLLFESLLYGCVGGLFGCGLGIGVLQLMTTIFANSPYGKLEVDIQFEGGQLVTAFVLAVILSLVSSFIPILKVSKLPVKDVVLNKIETHQKKRHWKLFVGLLLILLSLMLPPIMPRSVALMVDSILMITSFVGIIMLIPYVTHIFIWVFEKVYIFIFGNIGILSAKNLRDNKNILNNIALLTIGISSILMINTISHTVGIEVLNAYNDFTFDIWFSGRMMDRSTEQSIKSIDGVEATYGIYGTSNIELEGRTEKLRTVQGVNKSKYMDYFKYNVTQELLEELETGRYILVTHPMKEKLGLKKGDTLTLRMKRGKREYEVIGFFNSLMHNGDIYLVSERYYKMDMGEKFYADIFIKTTKDPIEVEKQIKKKFQRSKPYVSTMKEEERRNMEQNGQLLGMMQGFSIISMVIGIFGVLNNLLISFMERKHSLAVFRSVGMSKPQIIKMMFIESFTGGLIGGVVGMLGGLLSILVVQYVLRAINLPLTIHYSGALFINAMLAGIVIMVVSSIGPAMKSSKINIIEAIKYE